MTLPNPLLGTWRLVAVSALYPDGTVVSQAYGPNPSGYLTYTADGHMLVVMAQGDRAPLSQPVRSPFSGELEQLPTAELAQAFTSHSAYAGTYEFDGSTVTHHLTVASIPNRAGTDLVRTVTVAGDRMTLRTATDPHRTDPAFDLVWERA